MGLTSRRKAKTRAEGKFCLNCDNRHGCRTEDPLCHGLTLREDERWLTGQQLMARRGLLETCRLCCHFRQCWSEQRYRKAVAKGAL